MDIGIIEADLDDPEQGRKLVELIDSYARGPGGQSAPLEPAAAARIVPGLRRHASSLILLAAVGGEYVGAAVCFWLYSTFAGRGFLNIHDLVVLPRHQGHGIGTALLTEAERRARDAQCCKLTLEVHDANTGARRLYERFGFGPWSEATLYVSKRLA